MTYLPPDPPNQIPPMVPRPDRDPDEWQDEPGKRGRFSMSTTQFFVGLILLAVAVSVVAFLVRSSGGGGGGLDVEVLSPEDGSEHAPGLIVLRFRVGGRESSPAWELHYRRLTDGEEWTRVADGTGEVIPSRSVGGGGLQVLELVGLGAYELRLTVNDALSGEQVSRTVQFSVVE